MSLTNKALWVIERNFHRDLSLSELAESCGVSRFHLAHAFGAATGCTAMDYMRGRRLSAAAYALAGGAGDILSVALDAGYASHEAFTRAFRVQFDMTPEEVRKRKSVDGIAIVEPLHLPAPPGVALEKPRFEQTGELRFVGLSESHLYGISTHIPAQWQTFMSSFYGQIEYRTEAIPAGIATADDDGEFVYVCAAEVSRFGTIPKGLTKLSLAPATYAVFEHKGHIITLHQTYIAIWNDWLPESGKTPAEAPRLERHNPTFDPRTGDGGVKIWIPIEA